MNSYQIGSVRIQEKLAREMTQLQPFLDDPDVIEAMVNGKGIVHVDRMSVGKQITDITLTEMQRESIIGTIAAWHGQVVNAHSPTLQAEMPADGGRFQGMIRPVSAPHFVIRRPFNRVLPLEQFVAEGSMTAAQADFLREAVASNDKVLIGGKTLSGKTVLANSLIHEVYEQRRPDVRTILLEDTYEMTAPPEATNFEHLHTCDVADLGFLVQKSMRLSPDLFVIGEMRGAEAWDVLDGWTTGHGFSVSTVHAHDCLGTLLRLEHLIKKAGVQPDREEIGHTVNVLVAMERDAAHHWRVKEMARCQGWDGRQYTLSVLNPTQREVSYASIAFNGRDHHGSSHAESGSQPRDLSGWAAVGRPAEYPD
jgi:type IV secretion system protein VirB11